MWRQRQENQYKCYKAKLRPYLRNKIQKQRGWGCGSRGRMLEVLESIPRRFRGIEYRENLVSTHIIEVHGK
jgi:hypothetical protein